VILVLGGLGPGEEGVDKAFDVSVHHAGEVVGRELGPVVLDLLVGEEDVGANLVTPGDFGLRRLELLALLVLFAFVEVVQSGAENLQGVGLVLELGPLVLADDDDAGMWVRRTAELTLLTFWPPWPPARNASSLMSLGLISISMSSTSG
jgi:hypothetical protein